MRRSLSYSTAAVLMACGGSSLNDVDDSGEQELPVDDSEHSASGGAEASMGGSGGAVAGSSSGGMSGGDRALPDESSSGGQHEATGGESQGSGGQPAELGSGGGGSEHACPANGTVSYSLNESGSWPSDVIELIVSAMDEAVYQYNCYSNLSKVITVNYNPGVPTAEANVDGWLSFGANKSYMQVATAMHEVAHTLGVGYSPWKELMDDGLWIGPNVDALMSEIPAEQRDGDEYSQRDYIRGDAQHFWPYGLNHASEHQSQWSLINHVRIVEAMSLDKRAYLDGDL